MAPAPNNKMSMNIQSLINALEEVAPPVLQESYDNAGLIAGSATWEATGAVLCLDATEEVIDEAIGLGFNVVIAHHPIVFRPLKRFTGASYIERALIRAIKNDVAVYAAHTNIDNVLHRGVNAKIAERLGLTDTRVLSPRADTGSFPPDTGSGLIGRLAEPVSGNDFLRLLKERMKAGVIRHTPLLDSPVETVAVCGGSGGFLLPQAIAQGAGFFVTADYKYHEFFDAEGRIVIADIGHFESEQFTIELFYEILSEKFPNFALHCTKVDTNPVRYFK